MIPISLAPLTLSLSLLPLRALPLLEERLLPLVVPRLFRLVPPDIRFPWPNFAAGCPTAGRRRALDGAPPLLVSTEEPEREEPREDALPAAQGSSSSSSHSNTVEMSRHEE
jgi:hypothetical protein